MQTILITGGNGFLGSNLVKKLIGKYKLIVLEKNAADLFRLSAYTAKLKVYDVDTASRETIFRENKIDIILHTATIYGRNNETVENILNTNFVLPFSLIQLGIKYHTQLFINTDTVLERTVSPYALSKGQLRDWLKFYSSQLRVINMQLEHFYGPGGSTDNFISLMIQKLMANTPQIDLTAGEQKRDFVYFNDVVSAFMNVLDKSENISADFTNFQVASGEVICIRDLIVKLKELTSSSSTLNFGALPYRKNELMEPNTDNSTLTALGWLPEISLKQGLKLTIESLK